MDPSTIAVRAGLAPPEEGAPFLAGPVLAGHFHSGGDPAAAAYAYGRYGNPTWTGYEAALAQLEGGEAVVFASGMATIAAVGATGVEAGDVVLLAADAYFGGRGLLERELSARGVELRWAPTETEAIMDALPGAALVWIETPSNPGLDVCDVRRVAEAAHAAGARLVVDNTTATPLGQDALGLGADLVVSSDSKALTGHGDLILGHAATADARWADALRVHRRVLGAVPGPFEVWLAHRSLATLALRLERQCANAFRLAELLATRADVEAVRYQGLPDDPAHAVASAQMRPFGPVLTFPLPSAAHADRFLAPPRLVDAATRFGSVRTTAERRARWGGDDVPDGLIRVGVGCEHPDDLLADVAAALDAAGR